MAESQDERPSFDEASALPSFPDDGSPFGEFSQIRPRRSGLLLPPAATRNKLRNESQDSAIPLNLLK